MRILQAVRRHKQALIALIIVGAVALIFFASEGWATDSEVERSGAPSAPRLRHAEYETIESLRVLATTTTTTTTTTTRPAPKPIPAPVAPPAIQKTTGDVWEALRNCEAGGNYSTNTGNGYYGAYQFSAATWRSMGTAYEFAHLAPPEVQDDAAMRLQQRSGWSQWPLCTRKLGLR